MNMKGAITVTKPTVWSGVKLSWRSNASAMRCFLSGVLIAANGLLATPTVSNVNAVQRTGTNLVDITYDVSAPGCTSLSVAVAVSTNNGISYDLPVWNFSGDDYGLGVEPGTNRQITWHLGVDGYWIESTQVWFKVVASDRFDTNQMSLVPAGSFIMGHYLATNNSCASMPGDGGDKEIWIGEDIIETIDEDADEYPVHTVWLKTFSMAKLETSSEEVRRVMQWAYDNGKIEASAFGVTNAEGDQQLLIAMTNYYCDLAFSNGVFSVKDGKTNFPMVSITWYGAQAYCNYRSEMEGLDQCIDFSDWSCDFTKDGYRLPTEAEWEKAARGGLEGNRYPWPSIGGSFEQHIDGTRANYQYSGDPFESYEDGRTPAGYYDGGQVISNCNDCVTNDMANGYALYDMAGNVSDLCYDWYSSSYYSSSPGEDPTGPSRRTYRSARGGAWMVGGAQLMDCSARGGLLTNRVTYYHGFRCSMSEGVGMATECGPVVLETSDESALVPVYRLYSYGSPESTYEHLWTTSETEKDILDSWPSWQYEGIAWYAFTNQLYNTVPLYRLYCPSMKQHHYTIDTKEYAVLSTNGSWSAEGIQYYVYSTNWISQAMPAYRFFHAGLFLHHFTISEEEKASITNHPEWGYVYEGVGFYVFEGNEGLRSKVERSKDGSVGLPTSDQKQGRCGSCPPTLPSDFGQRSAVGKPVPVQPDEVRGTACLDPKRDSSGSGPSNPDRVRLTCLISLLASDIEHLIPLPGDYDGDGIEDMAYYEEPTGIWYFLGFAEEYDILGPHPSDTAMKSEEYQQVGRAFLPDRDRQECLSYLGCEQWLALDLRFQIAPLAQWGGPGFIPFSIDHDGDGISDLGVCDEDTLEWYVMSVDGRILVWMSEEPFDENTCNGKEFSQ